MTEWTEPGAYPVGDGVYRIPLPLPFDGLRAVNVYAIADGEQVVLIDSGWALTESEELLVKALDDIGYGLGDVREFLELLLVAQPRLDLGQGEQRAGGRAAHRLREVGVPATPVAHRRPADPRQPGDG